MERKQRELKVSSGTGRGGRVPLFKVDDAAFALCVSPKTLRDWILQQRIEVVRLGRAVRIPESEIDRLIAIGTTPAIRA